MRLFILLITILNLFACKDNSQLTEEPIKDTTLKILTYGLPDMNESHARNSIARKYGFSYYAVAGCVVSKELRDSILQENKKGYDILSKKFVKDWRSKFEEEVDTMRKLQPEIEKIVKKAKFIIEKEEVLNKENNCLYYDIDITPQKNIFTVKAYGWGKLNDIEEMLVYYIVSVDTITKSVKLISSTIAKR